jgi:two-component system, NarL family, sensor kinase
VAESKELLLIERTEPTDPLDALVEIQEQEGAALAGRLHDGPVQVLTAASLRLQTAAHFGELTPSVADEVAAGIAEAAAELRSVMTGLIAWSASDGDLEEAAHRYVLQACAAAGVRPHVELSGIRPLSPRHSAIAFRVLQEAIDNALRHSGTAELDVSVVCDDELALEVSDRGSGFDPSALDSHDAGGLRRMRSRIEALGGALTIDTAAGVGTTVHAVLPLSH